MESTKAPVVGSVVDYAINKTEKAREIKKAYVLKNLPLIHTVVDKVNNIPKYSVILAIPLKYFLTQKNYVSGYYWSVVTLAEYQINRSVSDQT